MTGIASLEPVRRYARAVWRWRRWALGTAWLVCLLGWAGVYALPDKYRASTRIFADADAVLGSLLRGIAIDNSPASQVEVLQRTLLSRPNLELILAGTGLAHVVDDTNREFTLQRLGREIRITNAARNLFTIEYNNSDPQIAYEVVKKAVDLFSDAAVGSDREQYTKATRFLEEQIALYETRLRDAEQRRAVFRTRYIDLLPSETYGGASRLEAGRARLRQLQGELEDAQNRRNLVRQQLDKVSPTLSVAAVIAADGNNRLAEAERNLRELRLRYTEQHPDVVTARSLVAELRSLGTAGRIAPGDTARPNPFYEQLKMRQVDTEAEVAVLERQLRDSELEVDRLEVALRAEPEVQAQFVNIDRDYNVLRRNFEELLARRESVRIADAARAGSDRVQLEVVDPPNVSNLPVGPPRKLFMGIVLIAGLAAGCGLALLLAQFDRSFYTVQDLRALGLPVLGSFSAPEQLLLSRLWRGATFGVAVVLLFLVFGVALYSHAFLAGLAA